ncbi:MAG: TIGR03618 family F420-dependent PPOX class oxidoreductase [SAR202 cluster bacterium]|jgi:PPOX class probable F420-dependent enzyme|nr:TIGR03618 family F420-dependent PPOX class oxidoreductase [SAR202 cluster bacterium]MDP6514613.1 TIGR03618 family F420-dependent PPOX class oxidoreductase [SAR202 cluster bacterium]MDP6715474.1 TIGR03618 family F420-dependent PPOX class oxidoreductase [SAR202 cluster bacterium]
MDFEDIRPFLENNHQSVVTTFQPNGAAQASIVVSGAYEGTAAFVSIRGSSAKIRNLRRDARCTVLNVTEGWRSYAVVEGTAQLFDQENTDSEQLRVLRRSVYSACGGGEHPDWEEYDQVMRQQNAVVVLVQPERIYGLLR